MGKKDIKNLWIMVGILIVTIVLLAILGCSPQKKLNKLIKKYPELLRTDTISFSDTIIRKGIVVREHTPIKFDTFIVEKENLRIELIRVHDTLFVKGEVKIDTFVVERKIPYQVAVVKELTFWEKYGTFIWILVFLLLIIVILYLIRRFFSL